MSVAVNARRSAVALAAGLLLFACAARAQTAPDPVLNPHTRAACLHCHKEGVAGPGRTRIFPSREEPHAAVASSCRSCHKEGAQDFWLLILPAGAGRPATAPAAPSAPLGGAPPASAPLSAPAAPDGGSEGFENSHDAMDCTGCHDKPAEQLKRGDAAPPRFAQQGADPFCRTCHAAVDRSHFPRGNVPPQGTTCLNCHRVHGRSLLYPSLRDDYPAVIAESAGLNPHGGRIFCLVCHPDTPQAGAPVSFRFPGNLLRLCQRCHAGVEHHPLGVKSTTATWKMDFARFPLENEAVTCVSCHDPPECQSTAGVNPRFLRGGPYNATAELCARCHEDKKFSSLNPHDQIDDNGEIYRKKCLYCHVTLPEAGTSADMLRYTDTLTALCVSCHQVGPHPDLDHLRPLSKKMRDNLAAYEEQRLVRLPLDDGNVTCVTCHNPHERGLLKGAAGIGADEAKKMRLTTFNEQCTPCHGRH
ncbi:MAG TPA: hypothetical protein VN317_07520 [Candidatus Methanoperedens sp.]|nr:hypothetical protein [Candidatus Methanoperedens sp.]